jgi:hypothetical protein
MEGAQPGPVSRGYRQPMINRLAHEVEADLAGRPALLRDASERALAYLGGLADRPVAPARAEAGAQAHTTVGKALGLVGLGRDRALLLPTDGQGPCWCGPTVWRGRAAMRVSVSAWNTTEQDIDRSVAAVTACASR